MRGFQVSISIKEKEHGSRYARPVLETGFMEVNQAFDEANRVIQHKFGTDEQFEVTRRHRKRREW